MQLNLADLHASGCAGVCDRGLTYGVSDVVVIRWEDDPAAAPAAALGVCEAMGLEVEPVGGVGGVGGLDAGLEGFGIVRCGRVGRAVEVADELGKLVEAGVLREAWVSVERPQGLRTVPTDPLLWQMWHLSSGGGYDLNAPGAWSAGYSGSGVVIGITELGYDHAHPDIAGAHNASLSQPGDRVGLHGTAVAGIAAGTGNNGEGGAGVAYGAQTAKLYIGTEVDKVAAFGHRNDAIWVKNNSWGPADTRTYAPLTSLEEASLESGVTTGRGGLGTVYVWAGGNGGGVGDRVDLDGYAGSRFTIAVNPFDYDGNPSVYAERGSCVLVSAPSDADLNSSLDQGIVAPWGTSGYTNLTGSWPTFGGSSSCAPMVSGVVALMLEANPGLGWRDVQHVLVESAVQIRPLEAGWEPNGAGRAFSELYGFGAVDAGGAVSLAEVWEGVGAERSVSAAGGAGVIPAQEVDPHASVVVRGRVVTESVELELDVVHDRVGDLRIELISPDGTRSVFTDQSFGYGVPGDGSGVQRVRFTSVRHWGELSDGVWRLGVFDGTGLRSGTVAGWSVTVNGAAPECVADWNRDGAVSVSDILDYLTSWSSGSGDMNYDGEISVGDALDFLGSWSVGCS